MKKILGIVLAIAGLTSVGVIHSASKYQAVKEQQNDNHGTYKERLKRAKDRGEKDGGLAQGGHRTDLSAAQSPHEYAERR